MIPINHRPILLPDTLLMDFLQNCIPIGDSSYEHTIDQKVRKNGIQPVPQTLLASEHIMEAELCRDDVVITVVYLKIEVLFGEVFSQCVESVRLVQVSPSPLVLLYTLTTEIC